ncbi:MAG: ribonuclease H-like domain-containing protein [Anaerolineales bacterium]|jgi:hypothetical protein
MSSLSEKLKALGVQVGANDLEDSKPRTYSGHTIEEVLPGQWVINMRGETFIVKKEYPADFQQGQVALRLSAPLDIIAAWAHEPGLVDLEIENFAFIDTETTGLMGGTGTYTFLIGVGRFKGDKFHVVQFFMQDPAHEAAQLAALETFLAPCEAVVTFNGKAFDIPLINTRYITHGWPPLLQDTSHLDLLHLARRLWRARLPSRALGDLEYHILESTRDEKDVPGWMIPDLYFDYLRTGDAAPLRSVFYHNEMDVVSMAALLNHMTNLIADPIDNPIEHGLDLISIGKLYQDLGFLETAAQTYQRGLTYDDLRKESYLDAIHKLSFLYKRRGEFENAIKLWNEAAEEGEIYAHIELAKFYEHKKRKYPKAIEWTTGAIAIINTSGFPNYERARYLPELEHRLARLERKLDKASP